MSKWSKLLRWQENRGREPPYTPTIDAALATFLKEWRHHPASGSGWAYAPPGGDIVPDSLSYFRPLGTARNLSLETGVDFNVGNSSRFPA
jgi:hypothetical protein